MTAIETIAPSNGLGGPAGIGRRDRPRPLRRVGPGELQLRRPFSPDHIYRSGQMPPQALAPHDSPLTRSRPS